MKPSLTRDDLPDMSAAYNEICRLSEKKLDPVGKEDGDVDNDGDKDSSDKYLMKRRKAISKAIKNEHHQKDADGKVIEHDDEESPGTPSSVEEAVAHITELSKKTLGSYVKKASKETRGNMMATQHGSGIPKKAKDIKLKQVNKRLKGMEKAGEKMAKEEVEVVTEVKDKKGKGSGSKDACYHKVKSRYSVWPSAYASGALVKCRKVGAANWGNSSKKEEFSDWKSEFIWEDGDSVKKITEDDMKGMSVSSGHKRPTKSGAGMTAKGVAAYRRRNPGSKLKTAVTTKPSKLKKGSKAAKRRKSYCARSAGQMKKFPKAAKDPNSRLRQARRRWNC